MIRILFFIPFDKVEPLNRESKDQTADFIKTLSRQIRRWYYRWQLSFRGTHVGKTPESRNLYGHRPFFESTIVQYAQDRKLRNCHELRFSKTNMLRRQADFQASNGPSIDRPWPGRSTDLGPAEIYVKH